MHGDLAASVASTSLSPFDSSATMTRDLAEAVGNLRMHIAADDAASRPLSAAARRRVMFSPMVAIALVTASATVPPAGIGLLAQLLDVGLAARQGDAARCCATSVWNSSLRATKSVSELTSTTTPARSPIKAATRPSAATRPAFLAALDRPFLRSQSTGGFDVAVGLGQRGLAVHHAGAGALAQFLHQSGGNRGHG